MGYEAALFPVIDTHTHLYDPVFDADRDSVLVRARLSGIQAIISVSETLADVEKNLALSRKIPMIKPAAGAYPSILDIEAAEEIIAFIRKNETLLVGVGEVGLDYWIVKSEDDRAIQREIFRRFIHVSLASQLPLNVHSRSAGRQAIEILLESGATAVQLHAFGGKASTAMPAVEAGYFFSIPPSIVRSRQKQKLVKHLPLSSLLIETDSPVLGPQPRQRNEPAFISYSIKAIAELKGVSEEHVRKVTWENTLRLYSEKILPPEIDSRVAR